MTATEPDVSVVIPCFRSRNTIGGTLESILRQDFSGSMQVLVADSSDDDTADWIRRTFPRVEVHHSKTRLLPGPARNFGVEQCRGRVIAFIDADAEAASNWLSTLYKRLHDHPDVVMTGAVVANANPELASSRVLYRLEFSEFLPGQPPRFCRILSSSNLLIRRKDFLAVNGFNPAYGMSEDMVFSLAIGRGLFLEDANSYCPSPSHRLATGQTAPRSARVLERALSRDVRGERQLAASHAVVELWVDSLPLAARVESQLAARVAAAADFARPSQTHFGALGVEQRLLPRHPDAGLMSEPRRPSICYAAPGQRLLGTAGSTRNVLSVAEAMSEWADVTVAFRSIVGPSPARGFKVISIDPPAATDSKARDDVAVRGLNPLAHVTYLRTLRGFAAQATGRYDVMFEKGWRFSGYLACQALKHGVPSALIENDARYRDERVRDLRSLARHLAHQGSQWLAARSSRRVPLVIAETEELKDALVALRGIAPERIEVVELGVDHSLFRPQDQSAARDTLRIDRGATVLLYVGGLDMYHDLEPLIEALGSGAVPVSLELHVVGDGELREEYESTARRRGVRAKFYGQVDHREVPRFVAAADLCLAPYQPSRFYAGKISFSTLKIPEYMACERPVASVPQGHIAKLIEHGSSGFLLANEIQAWEHFLMTFPAREHLAEMGRRAALRVVNLSWSATAARYLDLARRLSAAAGPGPVRQVPEDPMH